MPCSDSANSFSGFFQVSFRERNIVLQVNKSVRGLDFRKFNQAIPYGFFNKGNNSSTCDPFCFNLTFFKDFPGFRVNKIPRVGLHLFVQYIVPQCPVFEFKVRNCKGRSKGSVLYLLPFKRRTCCCRACINDILYFECHLGICPIIRCN
ncbi:hypothetical protein DSECCO2_355340 [anaerobic digester metagenome]